MKKLKVKKNWHMRIPKERVAKIGNRIPIGGDSLKRRVSNNVKRGYYLIYSPMTDMCQLTKAET